MKIKICLFVSLFLMLFLVCSVEAQPSVSAESAVVMVPDSGDVLFNKNMHDKMSMASTTKIMTSLIALEVGSPGREITVSEDMLKVEGTSIGLLPEDKITLKTLVYGMLLASGNDAANVAAISISGNLGSFSQLMNSRAKEIGMTETNFVTPSGLDDEEHYSTAYDMALLGCEAIKNPEFLDICALESAYVEYGNPPYRRRLTNHNRLLQSCFGTVGIKTGYTKKSGRCLVSAAKRNGITLVAVTLNAPNDWSDHKKLYEYSFDLVEPQKLNTDLREYSLRIIGGEKNSCALICSFSPVITVMKSEHTEIKQVIKLKKFEYAPIEQGDVLGCVEYYSNDNKIAESPIVSSESIKSITIVTDDKNTFFDRLKELLGCKNNG